MIRPYSQGSGIDTRASHMSASGPLGADSDRATRSPAPRPVAPYIADLEGDGADVRDLMRSNCVPVHGVVS